MRALKLTPFTTTSDAIFVGCDARPLLRCPSVPSDEQPVQATTTNQPRRVLALRGATTVEADDPRQVDERTQEMMALLIERNELDHDDLISVLFSCTHDLVSRNPATATRAMGIGDVPLLGVQEASMAGALPLCIRVMIHVETSLKRAELRHVFIRGAKVLRPDLVEAGDL